MEPFSSQDEGFRDRLRQAQDFLDPNDVHARSYRSDIMSMLQKSQRRLIVNLDHVRDYSEDLARVILETPIQWSLAFNQALKQIVETIPQEHPEKLGRDTVYTCGWVGSFGLNACNPRTLSSQHLNRMVSIDGIVTRCSLIRPKVVTSVHYNEVKQKFHFREYQDQSMMNVLGAQSVYPREDEEGNILTTEYGFCSYRDHQTISIQEMPERAPAGQLPRGVDVILDDDLVDLLKPGDRVHVVGIYRTMGNRNTSHNSAIFKAVLLANHISLLSSKSCAETTATAITDTDLRNIHKMAKRRNLLGLLSRSLAPSIYGHDVIKQAILLMLVGGVEKNLENGTHLRGDINILMVGDPSTAKSQLLRFVLNTAPLAIATTGRGSSGVGLTAAVTSDKETGERRLEAGAMVMADRGVVCIDEFDKMSDVDRVAIHEVMEQQTVTIAKAGIHTSLNARCSVIAAANPIFGQYDPRKDPHKNIALPDSLLSRFDLLFVVTDDIEDSRDRRISEHVLRMHRYHRGEDSEPVREQATDSSGVYSGGEVGGRKSSTVFEKYDSRLHATLSASHCKRGFDKRTEILSTAFMQKYIQYARMRIKPTLTAIASERVAAIYVGLRNDEVVGNQRRTSPLTVRTLETIIRLATASAKTRLSVQIDEQDVITAGAILRFALFKELTLDKSRTKRRKTRATQQPSSSDDGSGGEDDDSNDDQAAHPLYLKAQSTSSPSVDGTSDAFRKNLPAPAAPMNLARQDGLSQRFGYPVPHAHASSNLPTSTSAVKEPPGDDQMQHRGDTGEAEDSGAVELKSDRATIDIRRLECFRILLGQLLHTELFSDDCASLDTVLLAINRRIDESRETTFNMAEAINLLHELEKLNYIMFVNNQLIYKI